jgi:hypothetical protein
LREDRRQWPGYETLSKPRLGFRSNATYNGKGQTVKHNLIYISKISLASKKESKLKMGKIKIQRTEK